jgi:hypothetical protein
MCECTLAQLKTRQEHLYQSISRTIKRLKYRDRDCIDMPFTYGAQRIVSSIHPDDT